MVESVLPRPEDCCGGAALHEALRRQYATMVLWPEWPAPARVHAAVTTREGPRTVQDSGYGFNVGNRCGDDAGVVARNRTFLRDALGLPSDPVWLRQVHGTRVLVIDARTRSGAATAGSVAGPGAEPEADAAVTRTPGTVLAIQTADCLPVLFCTADGAEIAAAHAGWRGLAAGVLEATLAAMRAPRGGIHAWLGPAIAAASYEVGDEVRATFVDHAPAAASAFTPTRPGHWRCDLYALARQRLRSAGVASVAGGGFDTFTDSRLHSYRRDGAASGRMASLVWLDP